MEGKFLHPEFITHVKVVAILLLAWYLIFRFRRPTRADYCNRCSQDFIAIRKAILSCNTLQELHDQEDAADDFHELFHNNVDRAFLNEYYDELQWAIKTRRAELEKPKI